MFINIALSILLLFPLIASIFIFLLPSKSKEAIKTFALNISVLNFIISLIIYFKFLPNHKFQFTTNIPISIDLGIYYNIGVDGISLLLILVTTFFVPISILTSWNLKLDKLRTFYSSILMLESFMIGTLISLNMFFFYIFWELMLIPVFLLVGIWGENDRIKTTLKFFIYTMVGSLSMLFSILYIYQLHYIQEGFYSFNIDSLYNVTIDPKYSTLLFFTFLLAFAIKAPLFPFHTWLPDTYTNAPSSVTLLLSAIMAKLGVYGFIRFIMPIFSETFEYFSLLLMLIAVIGTIYAGIIAITQKDIKRIIAYSSISHLSYIILGVFAINVQSLQGSILHMLNHALSTGALFVLIGFLELRLISRNVNENSGLIKKIPILGAIFMVIMFSSIGLPGLNGFVSEFLIFLGVFKNHPTLSTLGATTIIIGAIYMLNTFSKTMFGNEKFSNKSDFSKIKNIEIATLTPIILLIFLLGIYPKPFLSKIEPSVIKYVDDIISKTENTNNISFKN
ncbi:MAG: NADH:ubiquinone oxidoreductase subunit M [Candidatus Sericytochromatia bacterium]|nr:MAG: NADH:ubiquinone oxidoreductase subunit M [Candidatus Sericytochromatia bacterium]